MLNLFALCLLAISAQAMETPTAINIGAFGVIDPRAGPLTQYVYFGPSISIPLTERVAFVPSLTMEVAPGSGAWGFTATGMFEVFCSEHVGLDFVPALVQDTIGHETEMIVALGPGITYFTDHEVGLGFALQGANVIGQSKWSVNPLLNLSIPFP